MNQHNKKKFPLIAALLSSKVLKQIAGDSRDPMPCFVIRGHETMSVTLHIKAEGKAGFWIECEADEIDEAITEACALVAFFAHTWESTREYALDELRKMLPEHADKLSSSFFA